MYHQGGKKKKKKSKSRIKYLSHSAEGRALRGPLGDKFDVSINY